MTTGLADMSVMDMIAGAGMWIVILSIFVPGLFAAIETVFEAVFVVIALTLAVSYRIIVTISALFGTLVGVSKPKISRILLLIGFVLLELLRREAPEPEPEPEFEHEPDHGPGPKPRPHDPIAWALATLGLTREDLTPETLKQAYRQAIRAAHPDVTGNADEAVRINRARDAIRKHFGWT